MTVDLHLVDLDADRTPDRVLEAALVASELERLERFRLPLLRRRFLVRRVRLREILLSYRRRPDRPLQFEYGPRGKPGLTGNGLKFSASSSRGLALIVVSNAGDVGCDIEWIDEGLDWESLADLVLTERERAMLTHLDERSARAMFFRAWSIKEGYFKATGYGVSNLPGQLEALTAPGRLRPAPRGWSWCSPPVCDGFSAAVTLKGRHLRLRDPLLNCEHSKDLPR